MPVFVYDIWSDGRAAAAEDMAATGPGTYRWFHFDLGDPELAGWAQRTLPAIPAAALLDAETRPRCDLYEDGIILNLRAVNLNPDQSADQMLSVRLWVTAQTVVTVRRMPVFALTEIGADCSAGRAPGTVGRFLVALTQKLARRVHDVVLELDRITEAHETGYEDSDTAPDAAALKDPRRQVIRMLRYVSPQGAALDRLVHAETAVLTRAERTALREPVNLMALSQEVLTSLKARLEALHEAAHTAVTAQMARNNYILSLVAALFLPLGFFTGLFGVNLGGIPGSDSPLGFGLLCLALAATGGLVIAVLRWLRLL